jgi:hypothetical protein
VKYPVTMHTQRMLVSNELSSSFDVPKGIGIFQPIVDDVSS